MAGRRNPRVGAEPLGGFAGGGPTYLPAALDRSAEFDELRRMLTERRRALLVTRESQQGELRALHAQDRDPEYEEGAQVKLADDVLTTLSETARREVMQIDAALGRMDEG